MNEQTVERRRLLQFLMLGSVAVPALALAGCAAKGGGQSRPPRRYGGGGGNRGGEKSGGGGGIGGRN